MYTTLNTMNRTSSTAQPSSLYGQEHRIEYDGYTHPCRNNIVNLNVNVNVNVNSVNSNLINSSVMQSPTQCNNCLQISDEETCAFSNHYFMERKCCIMDLDSKRIVYSPTENSPVCNHHVMSIPFHKPNNQEFSKMFMDPEYFLMQQEMDRQQQQQYAESFNNGANQVIPNTSQFPQMHAEQFEDAAVFLPTSTLNNISSARTTNNAHRSKTHHCAACDKWFTSAAYLQRHYHSNLHKNSVNTSDPATVRINHHVPSSNQNSENTSQHLSPFEFQEVHEFQQMQELQYCGTAPELSSSAYQLEGLNDTGTCRVFVQQDQTILQPTTDSHIMDSQNHYNANKLTSIDTNTETSEIYHSSTPASSVSYPMTDCQMMSEFEAHQGDTESGYSSTILPSPVSIGVPSVPAPVSFASLTCTLCDKIFSKSSYLRQHNKTHHSGYFFKCGKCGKRFPSEIRRDQHLAKHDGVKPFRCEFEACEKSFNHDSDLQRHKIVHTGYTKHNCENCKKGFVRKDHMLKHMKTVRCKPQPKI